MLQLKDITKDYAVAGESVHALKGVSVNFRKSEFVSILGPSGCGKTTLLNIIGGLDKYTSGDLIIAGKSTKEYGDRDWDTYRNHSIGFIFQSYHLIPHQTILQNVELALMIAGVSKAERRQRAIDALEKVGLKDKIKNRPNQLSGGQAQRVAIARALINDPEIVLADEPTGALDSVTSVQIMELLKEISKDRLVIMVTHNPELAEKYSTRIVRLLDGEVVGDSMPYDGVGEEAPAAELRASGEAPADTEQTNKGKRKKTAMSPGMAMGLSFKNLLSKRKRTAMVSIAGSIGIIGVSLVLAISAGVRGYINTMQNDMLSGYPVSITRSAIDYSALLNMSVSSQPDIDITKLDDKLYVQSIMDTLGGLAKGATQTNEITEAYIDYVGKIDKSLVNVVQYDYGFNIANNIYTDFEVGNALDDDSGKTYAASRKTSVTAIRGMYSQILGEQEDYQNFTGVVSSISTFEEVPDSYEYVLSQFDVLAAETSDGVTYDAASLTDSSLKELFSDKQALIMVVDDSMITDIALGQYGYFTQEEFLNYAFKAVGDDKYDEQLGLVGSGLGLDGTADSGNGLGFDRFIGENSKKFTWYPNDQIYRQINGTYLYLPYEEGNFTVLADNDGNITGTFPLDGYTLNPDDGMELGVKLILQKKEGLSYSCMDAGIYYTGALTEYMLENSRNSEIVKSINDSEKGYLSRLPYSLYYTSFVDKEGGGIEKAEHYGLSYITDSSSFITLMASGLSGDYDKSSLLRVTADMLGGAELPTAIYIYPTDFNTKKTLCEYLDKWNAMCNAGDTYCYTVTAEGDDGTGTEESRSVVLDSGMKIVYSDTVGMIISMINTMINIITIALVAFTALSLVVSTVMIGIITYVSVVERIKEIGILRAVGARKKDIKRLFNAETFMIGLVAGLFGILITYVISLIVNVVVYSLAGIWGIAALPVWQAVIMVALSVVLTLISGLIPASAAAKKDPVVALRTE